MKSFILWQVDVLLTISGEASTVKPVSTWAHSLARTNG